MKAKTIESLEAELERANEANAKLQQQIDDLREEMVQNMELATLHKAQDQADHQAEYSDQAKVAKHNSKQQSKSVQKRLAAVRGQK